MKSFAIILAMCTRRGTLCRRRITAIIIDTGLKNPSSSSRNLLTLSSCETWFETIKESFRDSPVRDALAEGHFLVIGK